MSEQGNKAEDNVQKPNNDIETIQEYTPMVGDNSFNLLNRAET